MVVSRSCIQMVLSQVWSKLVCSNGKWIRKSGLTQPLMWLKRRSGGNWNVQALQPCMFLEMYRPYNPVCFFCLVCTHKPGWCGMYPKEMVSAPGVTCTQTKWFRHLQLQGLLLTALRIGRALKPDNIVYIMKGSPWKTWPIHMLVDQSGIDGPSQIKKGRLFEIIRP